MLHDEGKRAYAINEEKKGLISYYANTVDHLIRAEKG
jgi:hypothetical protein